MQSHVSVSDTGHNFYQKCQCYIASHNRTTCHNSYETTTILRFKICNKEIGMININKLFKINIKLDHLLEYKSIISQHY